MTEVPSKEKPQDTIEDQLPTSSGDESPKDDILNAERMSPESRTTRAVMEQTRGHFPPPIMLKGYCELHADAAKIFFEEFVKNAEHRREQERREQILQEEAIRKEQNTSAESYARGQRFGLIIGVICVLTVGVTGVWIGNPWVIVGGLGTVAAVITAVRLIDSRNSKPEKKNEESAKPSPQPQDEEGEGKDNSH